MEALSEQLESLEIKFKSLSAKLDLTEKKKLLRQLTAESVKSGFWSDILEATKTMENISQLKGQLDQIGEIQSRIDSVKELLDLSSSENRGFQQDLENEIVQIQAILSKVELAAFLSGPYDANNAILSIHAGQGGTEAMDWSQILLRMYLRFAEKKGWKTSSLTETKGEEAGIKSVSVEINGSLVYGYLKHEAGTHRLVRQSPFNADRLRQTSFALVEVLPVIGQTSQITISAEDLDVDTFRSSGPGGQNVQKVETAVRIKHKPSGIVVAAQSERSQAQNKENALKLLKGKLFALEEEKRKQQEKKLKGNNKAASWGTQIRNYVLHPYKLVKDLRTGVESSDPEKVLSGDLEEFIEAGIKIGGQ